MRKINDAELMTLIESGKSQKHCAEHFGVSPSAINQRIKRLKPYIPPESFKKLTDKEKAFVLAKVEGKTNLEAVRGAYDVTTKESAKSLGTTLMKDPDINRAIHDVLYEHGLSISNRIERLKWLVNHVDPTSVYRGLDMANKMAGGYAPIRVEHDIGVLIATIRELQAQRLEEDVIDMEYGN
jgi:predicted transcriptional regulator